MQQSFDISADQDIDQATLLARMCEEIGFCADREALATLLDAMKLENFVSLRGGWQDSSRRALQMIKNATLADGQLVLTSGQNTVTVCLLDTHMPDPAELGISIHIQTQEQEFDFRWLELLLNQ